MSDIVDQATRSRMMAGIRGKNTRPELVLRRALHARGFRYRLHARDLPGKPDLVLPRYKVVIFVHGCFWHRHERCRYATTPSTRTDFWEAKFSSNIDRDRSVQAALHLAGWRVAIVWECALRRADRVAEVVDILSVWFRGSTTEIIIGEADIRK